MRTLKPMSDEQTRELATLMEQSKTKADFKRVQVLWLRATLNLDTARIALAVGLSPSTVKSIQGRYFRDGGNALLGPGRGGRRHSYLTLAEETEWLTTFRNQAATGEIVVIGAIKAAYERKVGKAVPKSTIYRLLSRHGWRKILPRPRHPQGDPLEQAAFKKNSRTLFKKKASAKERSGRRSG